MDISLIREGDIVNFDMIRPGIFGDQYKGAIVSAICDYNTARYVDPDINSKHANFYPFFKDKVDNVDNPGVYKYMVLQLDKTVSKLIVIGFPWINQDSLKTLQTRYATIIIRNWQEAYKGPTIDFLEGLGAAYQYTITDQ